MVDLPVASSSSKPSNLAAYNGPERRGGASARQWLMAMLDEIDYGMVLVAGRARILHLNHAARLEFDRVHPLQVLCGELRARSPQDVAPLFDALHSASQRGLRKLLTLGDGSQRVCVSIVPLPAMGQGDGAFTLVTLGKRQVCGTLAVQGFARCHGLTAAETRVLEALSRDARPSQIAAQLGVGIATVRTQIGNIRLKTGAPSIRALVWQVAGLPPMMSALRSISGADFDRTG